ncbi:MAG: hypothetical protein R3F40_05765 [Candidatus Competibacteraceae bacterium]
MLSTVVLALAAEVTGGRVRGEARWLVSWDAGVLAYLALSWLIVVLLIRQEPGAGSCARRRPALRSLGRAGRVCASAAAGPR